MKKSTKQALIAVVVAGLSLAGVGVLLVVAESGKNQRWREIVEPQGFLPDGSHRALTEKIKESLDDPDSFRHVKTTKKELPDGSVIVACKFRAKNQFNAVVLSSISAKCSHEGKVLQILQPAD